MGPSPSSVGPTPEPETDDAAEEARVEAERAHDRREAAREARVRDASEARAARPPEPAAEPRASSSWGAEPSVEAQAAVFDPAEPRAEITLARGPMPTLPGGTRPAPTPPTRPPAPIPEAPDLPDRPVTPGRPKGRGGIAAVGAAIGEAGLSNLTSRDVRRLERDHGITLDPDDPDDAAIAEEYTQNRGTSEMTRIIADNVTRAYAPSTMPEAQAVEVVRERLETRAIVEERPAAFDEIEAHFAANPDAAADSIERDDDTCAPEGTEGTWVVKTRRGGPNMPAAMDYQRQVTHTPELPDDRVVEYEVSVPGTSISATFDGCAYWTEDRELLEAKHGHGAMMTADRIGIGWGVSGREGLIVESGRQAAVAGLSHPVDWHISDASTQAWFEETVATGTGNAPNFSVVHTPKD